MISSYFCYFFSYWIVHQLKLASIKKRKSEELTTIAIYIWTKMCGAIKGILHLIPSTSHLFLPLLVVIVWVMPSWFGLTFNPSSPNHHHSRFFYAMIGYRSTPADCNFRNKINPQWKGIILIRSFCILISTYLDSIWFFPVCVPLKITLLNRNMCMHLQNDSLISLFIKLQKISFFSSFFFFFYRESKS